VRKILLKKDLSQAKDTTGKPFCAESFYFLGVFRGLCLENEGSMQLPLLMKEGVQTG
jgi:hypothetical protein